jgi:hypothetical protein
MMMAVMMAALCAVLPAAASPTACGAHCTACARQYNKIEGARCAECDDGYLVAADGLCGEL